MAAKHTYAKINGATATIKSIFVGAEFDANTLVVNTTGIYATFCDGKTIGHIAVEDMALNETGQKFFKEGKVHMKFKKQFRVRVKSVDSTVKLIGTGSKMYDLEVI